GYAFSSSGGSNAFTINAAPLTAGSTGTRYFFSDESGVIRYNTAGTANNSSSPLGQ
ncbi:MAG: pili assembly chaperone, partial [Acidobacteria bacterium]|nr:pili assembly chaperone [Acidobacteriota bacterium]